MQKVSIFIAFTFLCVATYAQKSFNITGKVFNKEGESLPAVSLFISALNKGTTTGANGDFSFSAIPQGKYLLEISSIGYKPITKEVNILATDISLKITLEEQVEMLKEVVISENKKESAKLRNTLSVDVVDSEYINENLGGSLMQTLDNLAGISSVEIGSGQSKPVIRGLSFNRILVAEKGLKHEGQQWGADHGLEVDQYDAQNIEVLKGPSSLSFGSDAIGGVIHLKRNNLPEKNSFHGSFNTSYMSNNEALSGSVHAEKRNNKFLIGARATFIKYADYKVPTDFVNVYTLQVPLHNRHLRNTAGNENSFHLNTGYIGENFHSIFYLSRYNASSGFFANAHGLEPRKVDNDFYDASKTDIDKPMQEVTHYKITNETSFNFSKHYFKILLGFQKNIREEKGNYINHGYMPPIYPQDMKTPNDLERKFVKDFYALKFTDNLEISKHNLEIGVDANYQRNEIDGWGFIIPNFKQHNLGAFAIDTYPINELIKINAGLRYDYGYIDIKSYQDWFESSKEDGTKEYLTRVEPLKKSYHNVSFALGAIYTKNEWTLKANIGNSFRMPIAKELAANGINYHYFRYEKGNRDLNPERSYQLDINTIWNKQNISITISPFVNYFPNYIYLNPTADFDYLYGAGNQIFNYTQSKVFRYGAELNASVNLFNHLELETIGEYVKSRQISGAKKNYGLPFAPPPTLSFKSKYTFDNYNVFKKPYASAEIKYTAKQNDIVPPEKPTEGYQLINIGLGTEIELGNYKMLLNLQVKNLLDTKYFNHTNFYRLIDLPEQGRNISLALKLSF